MNGLVVTCVDNDIIDDTVKYFEAVFRYVKEKSGPSVGYMGMRVKCNKAGICVDMDAYTLQVLKEYRG